MRTRVKGLVSDTSFMACRHSKVETAFYLALHVHLGGE